VARWNKKPNDSPDGVNCKKNRCEPAHEEQKQATEEESEGVKVANENTLYRHGTRADCPLKFSDMLEYKEGDTKYLQNAKNKYWIYQ